MSEQQIFAKCAWRILPLVTIGYALNYLDRTNVGFAALTMNKDLGFTPLVYGLGAGIFYLSYSLLMVPANLMMRRIGARRWLSLLFVSWGAAASANALIQDVQSFYALRLLLGIAEAGFFPGVIFYLTLWFPKAYLARANAVFMCATTSSLIIGGPLASLILGFDGVAGIHGWQWLFLLEGIPTFLMGFVILKLLPDRPQTAPWLANGEQTFIVEHLRAQDRTKQQDKGRALRDPRVLLLGLAYGGFNFAVYGFSFWLPLIVQGMGFSNTANGFIIALVYVGTLPTMLLWARSSDRNGERTWHIASATLLGSAMLLAASVAPNAFLALLALALAGMAIWSIYGPFFSLSSSFLSGPAMASGYALVNALGNLLGGFAGQYLIGYLREQTGGYSAALVAIAAALVMSTLIVLRVGRAIAPKPALAGVQAADA